MHRRRNLYIVRRRIMIEEKDRLQARAGHDPHKEVVEHEQRNRERNRGFREGAEGRRADAEIRPDHLGRFRIRHGRI